MSYEESLPSTQPSPQPSPFEFVQTAGRLTESFEVLIVFVVFAYLALRTRSVRSFQFQISSFMLLWAIAEFPQALGKLGIIDTRPILLPGLVFHTASMILFAFFISYRFIPFTRVTPVLQLDESTKQLVIDSVQKGLAASLGENTAKAVNFYVDPDIATKDPAAYMKGLRKMFGEGAKLLEDRIEKSLCEKAGMPQMKGKSFAEHVLAARREILEKTE